MAKKNNKRQVVPLKHPVTVTTGSGDSARSEEITELNIRRPKLKDLRGIDIENITGDVVETLLERLTGLDPLAVGEIDAEDLEPISEVIGGFFGTSRQGGKASSPKSGSVTGSAVENSGT